MSYSVARDAHFSNAERDACGIGFVADARGRPSRAVVQAALDGLACVVHRGAVAADSLTADGSGVLLAIPESIFGPDRGVAALFVRGQDPRAEFEALAALEGIRVVEWRTPPTDEILPRPAGGRVTPAARACGPRGQRAQPPRACRVPTSATRRPIAARHLRRQLLVPHHRLQGPGLGGPPGRLLPRPRRTTSSRRSSSSTNASAPTRSDVGAGPAVPHALPQR